MPAGAVVWQVGDTAAYLFALGAAPSPPSSTGFAVPRAFLGLARKADLLHREPERFALLYLLLTRASCRTKADGGCRRSAGAPAGTAGEGGAARHPQDARFLCFREVEDGEGRDRRLVRARRTYRRANAGFFLDPFRQYMRWSILTPELSLHWKTARRLGEGRGAWAGG